MDEVLTVSLLIKHNAWCDDAGGTGNPQKAVMETWKQQDTSAGQKALIFFCKTKCKKKR